MGLNMRQQVIKSIELAVAVAVLALRPATPVQAANVILLTNDAMGTSSFVGATNWSNVAVPMSTNTYFTGALTIRTTNTVTSGVTYPFNGASLSVDPGGRMLGKIGNNNSGNTTKGTITGNFILNGGNFEQA